MGLKESLENFVEKKYALPVILVVTIGIDLLLLTMATCYTVVLMGILTFALPYYIGIRNVKKFFVVGILAFLVVTLAWAPIFLSQTQAPANSLSGGTVKIMGATVTPYKGTAGTEYNFTATVYSTEAPPDLYLNYQKINANNLTTVRMNTAAGSTNGMYECYYNTTLDEGIYYFDMNMSAASGNVSTPPRPGPINADFNAAYMHFYPLFSTRQWSCSFSFLFCS